MIPDAYRAVSDHHHDSMVSLGARPTLILRCTCSSVFPKDQRSQGIGKTLSASERALSILVLISCLSVSALSCGSTRQIASAAHSRLARASASEQSIANQHQAQVSKNLTILYGPTSVTQSSHWIRSRTVSTSPMGLTLSQASNEHSKAARRVGRVFLRRS